VSKELYTALEARGLLEFGSVILADFVRETLNIVVPEVGTREVFTSAALEEMAAVDYVRRLLLREGKYIAGNKGDYRILLPSENKRQVDIYMNQADKKLRRALQLSTNSPVMDTGKPDQTRTRIMMKMSSARSQPGASAS
jgi:hypothetical protein